MKKLYISPTVNVVHFENLLQMGPITSVNNPESGGSEDVGGDTDPNP
jgi:hypothetical protein